MTKKLFLTVAAATFMLCSMATLSFASDMGPEEITLEATGSDKPKPAYFPHKAHQESLECAECHHSMKDGKQVPYVEGQEIAKCESCHNSEVLPDRKSGKNKLDTLKGAGHANCLECHREVAKEDESKKALKKCSTCHKK